MHLFTTANHENKYFHYYYYYLLFFIFLFLFFLLWTVRSGPSLFRPSKVYISDILGTMLILNNIVRWRHFQLKKIDSNSLLPRFLEVWRFQFLFIVSAKENDLILASPRFEPTTFLIQVNTSEYLPPRPRCLGTTTTFFIFVLSFLSFFLSFLSKTKTGPIL